jgi:hypothetical protein
MCMCVFVYVCVDSESYTTTAAPEKPRNPLAVSGTWHSICMYVSQCLCVSMYELDWKCRRCLIMYANSKYTVCMYVCVLVQW